MNPAIFKVCKVYVINPPEKPSCIDLFLTNFPRSFQNTQTIETGLSDFHKLAVTILKMYLPKVITYRDFKNFDNSRFSEGLLSELYC